MIGPVVFSHVDQLFSITRVHLHILSAKRSLIRGYSLGKSLLFNRRKGHGSGCTTALSGLHRLPYLVYCWTPTPPCAVTIHKTCTDQQWSWFQNSALWSCTYAIFMTKYLHKRYWILKLLISKHIANCIHFLICHHVKDAEIQAALGKKNNGSKGTMNNPPLLNRKIWYLQIWVAECHSSIALVRYYKPVWSLSIRSCNCLYIRFVKRFGRRSGYLNRYWSSLILHNIHPVVTGWSLFYYVWTKMESGTCKSFSWSGLDQYYHAWIIFSTHQNGTDQSYTLRSLMPDT